MLEVILFTDGGSREGQMALGFAALDKTTNKILFEGQKKCGKGTSNIAEYRALIAGLIKCVEEKVDIIHIMSDSQLVVKQVSGSFECNKKELKEHKDSVCDILKNFTEWTIKWIPRHKNRYADSLVDKAFKKGKKGKKNGVKKSK